MLSFAQMLKAPVTTTPSRRSRSQTGKTRAQHAIDVGKAQHVAAIERYRAATKGKRKFTSKVFVKQLDVTDASASRICRDLERWGYIEKLGYALSKKTRPAFEWRWIK